MSITAPAGVFGTIISRRDVEQAVIALLQTWIPTYLPAMEGMAGLSPRTIPLPPDLNRSYRGGIDYNTWEQAWAPVYIVNVTPVGRPERVSGEGLLLQTFEIRVAVNFAITHESASLGLYEEDSARQYTDMLGMAACAVVMQHASLGTWPNGNRVSHKTELVQYPLTTLPYPDERRVARSEFVVNAVIGPVLSESAGPASPLASPYVGPGSWPTVADVNITVSTVPDSATVPPNAIISTGL